MIEAASSSFFMFITTSLTAAFVYYGMKYQKFMKEKPA